MADWKATEFRCFGAYTDLLVFHKFFGEKLYKHFLLLFCAIRLLSNANVTSSDINRARALLQQFVEEFSEHYDSAQVCFNVHVLLHLADCVTRFGPLPELSVYPFENFLRKIKKQITKPSQILAQLRNRIPNTLQ